PLTASAFDANGHAVAGAPFTWTSNAPDVAAVDDDGVVTGGLAGDAVVTASFGDLDATTDVTVTAGAPASIEVTPDALGFASFYETGALTAVVKDAHGNVTTDAVTWQSLDTNVATVDAAGIVTALRNGSTHVRATAGAATLDVPITVQQVAATLSIVSGADQAGAVGTTLAEPLVVEVRDAGGSPVYGVVIEWAVTQGGGDVDGAHQTDGDGLASATWTLGPEPGAQRVRATVAGLDSVVFIATANGLPDLRIAAADLSGTSVLEGESITVTVTVANDGGSPAPATKLRLRVRETGTPTVVLDTLVDVAAIPAGESAQLDVGILVDAEREWPASASIRLVADARDDVAESDESNNTGGSAAFAIALLAGSITLDADSLDLDYIGGTVGLRVSVYDRFGRPTTRPYAFTSSDPDVATVDAAGVVTAVSNGTARITVQADGVDAHVDITVQQQPASLTVTPDSLVLEPGDMAPLTAVVRDEAGIAIEDAVVTWRTLDGSIAEVSADGVVDALGVGRTTIVAAHGELEVETPVRVDEPADATHTWVGGAAGSPRDWHHAANWSPASVPGIGDIALVRARAAQPRLEADAIIGGLIVAEGARIDLAGYRMAAHGAVDVEGVIEDGVLVLAGAAQRVLGTLPDVRVTGTPYAAGAIDIMGSLALAGGELDVRGQHVRVHQNVTGSEHGVVRMNDPAGILAVSGSVTLGNGNTIGRLTAGVLRIGGDFDVTFNTPPAFAPSGTHTVVLDGTALQRVATTHPGSVEDRRHFRNLVIENSSAAGVRFENDIPVTGNLDVYGRLVVTAARVLGVTGELRLHPGSILQNSGVVKYGSWTLDLGTIIGNRPIPR
ncbi:MAG TPA: Ig-like domain-containing protein, partial [Longimicrobiales bacterium]|nr:Ig-like domain-containing protein [Longimicrobiales bacterium]